MRKVYLRMNEQQKYETVKELVTHNGNKKRAALKLNISMRQINRLIVIYKEKGKSDFIHGNRSKKPVKTLDKSISEDIVLLYADKYQGANFKHFHELLESRENTKVSYNFIYTTLMKENYKSPKIHKATKKKLLREKLEKDNPKKTETEIEETVNREMAIEDAHPRQERSKYFGEKIEMDASSYIWFGPIKVHLHLAIDNCTGTIVGGYFDKQETLNGYYNVFKQILMKYGIPYGFLTDNRTVFHYESIKTKTSDKDVLTQFGYACKTLGVNLETTSIPQEKPVAERLNQTVQSRLPIELKLEGITCIEQANKYLVNTFIPEYNKRFALPLKGFETVFEESPSKDKINYTLAVLTSRKFDKGNAIKFKNNYFMPYKNNNLVCIIPKTECLVIEAFNKELLVTVGDKIYNLQKMESHKRLSENFDTQKIEKEEKKKCIPPMTHPWRLNAFKDQIKKAHTTHVYA